jgi:hypothetical protein
LPSTLRAASIFADRVAWSGSSMRRTTASLTPTGGRPSARPDKNPGSPTLRPWLCRRCRRRCSFPSGRGIFSIAVLNEFRRITYFKHPALSERSGCRYVPVADHLRAQPIGLGPGAQS